MSKYLQFTAGDCELVINVANVREVVPAATLSAVADGGRNLEGWLNLRGAVVPVISLEVARNIRQPALSDSDFLVIVADSHDRPFAIRANDEVRFVEDAEAVVDSHQQSNRGYPLVRIGSQLATVLATDDLSPHDATDGEASAS